MAMTGRKIEQIDRLQAIRDRFRRKLDYHASKDYHLQTFRACRVLYIFPTKNLIEKICQVLTHSMHKVTH